MAGHRVAVDARVHLQVRLNPLLLLGGELDRVLAGEVGHHLDRRVRKFRHPVLGRQSWPDRVHVLECAHKVEGAQGVDRSVRPARYPFGRLLALDPIVTGLPQRFRIRVGDLDASLANVEGVGWHLDPGGRVEPILCKAVRRVRKRGELLDGRRVRRGHSAPEALVVHAALLPVEPHALARRQVLKRDVGGADYATLQLLLPRIVRVAAGHLAAARLGGLADVALQPGCRLAHEGDGLVAMGAERVDDPNVKVV